MRKEAIPIIFLILLAATISAQENQTTQLINEQVKCIFLNSGTEQQCYGENFACRGIGTCIVEVSGEQGKKLAWKSTCGGYAETTIDGQNDEISINCEQLTQQPQQPQPVTEPTPAPTQTCTDSDGGKNYEVKGTSKDRYIGEITDYCRDERTLEEHWCQDNKDGRGPIVYIENHWCDYGCKDGICLPMPTPVCGNGICESEDEKANCPKDCGIKCYQDSDCGESTTTKSCGSKMMAPGKQYPDNYYACTTETYNKCENPGTASARCVGGGGASCIPCPQGCKDGECIGETAPTSCTDPDGTDYFISGKTCSDNNCEIDRCEGNTLIEYICDGNYARVGFTYGCPNGCKDGACIKGEEVSEQITCIFTQSDKEQECYIAGGFSEADQGIKFCKGKDSCIINYKGNKGEQITWKSTCGGYQYTTQDGNNNEIKFGCKAGETNLVEIKSKGFRFAYWQCYDGSESKSEDTTSCKPSEVWQKYAIEFCNGKCNKDNGKCGVNSFSISNECYSEPEAAIPSVPTVQASGPEVTTAPTQGMLYYFKSDDCPHCQAMDEEIGALKLKGFFKNFGAAVFNIEEPDISRKYEIKAVPTFILYKDGCMFRKEGFIKSDEIESWAYNAKCEEKIEEIKGEITEPILVCKDSCPLDGKCYPFGYRKTGKFCSDEGKFTEQLKGDEACENNFECSSNVCVDERCISSGLIRKIIDWFRGIFGIS